MVSETSSDESTEGNGCKKDLHDDKVTQKCEGGPLNLDLNTTMLKQTEIDDDTRKYQEKL